MQRRERGGVAQRSLPTAPASPRANRRAMKPIIGAAGGRHPAAARRARADRAASAAPSSSAAAPSRATQPMSGAACCSTAGGGGAARPGRRDQLRGRTDDARPAPVGAARTAARSGRAAAAPWCARRRRRPGSRPARCAHRSPRPRWCCRRAATCGAASAESVDSPIAGLPAASAMPRAAEMPTRRPVKLPGPTVTAMRSSSANSSCAAIHHARDQRHQGFGMAAQHRQRFAREDAAALRDRARRPSRRRARCRWRERA